MPQESHCGDFSSRVFLNNARIIMCAKPVSIDVNSSLVMGVRRICPHILPSRVALENIYEAWQKNRWRCVAQPIASCVFLQTPADSVHHISGEEQKPGRKGPVEITGETRVLRRVVVAAPYGEIK